MLTRRRRGVGGPSEGSNVRARKHGLNEASRRSGAWCVRGGVPRPGGRGGRVHAQSARIKQPAERAVCEPQQRQSALRLAEQQQGRVQRGRPGCRRQQQRGRARRAHVLQRQQALHGVDQPARLRRGHAGQDRVPDGDTVHVRGPRVQDVCGRHGGNQGRYGRGRGTSGWVATCKDADESGREGSSTHIPLQLTR